VKSAARILILMCAAFSAVSGLLAGPAEIQPDTHPYWGIRNLWFTGFQQPAIQPVLSPVEHFSPLPAADSTLACIVIVESRDANGNMIGRGAGILLKKGYVATNYHLIAGAPQVVIVKPGEFKEFPVDGYLTVEESKDIIMLSVPGITGTSARLSLKDNLPEGYTVTLVERMQSRQFKYAKAEIRGRKDLMGVSLQQVVSRDARDCISGPVFGQGEMVGFTTAGYLDGRYYSYMISATELSRIQNRSFIIKDIHSLPDSLPMQQSHFQTTLMSSLTSILWMPLQEAEIQAKAKKKKVMITIYTDWCGWCTVMNQNTWNKLKIIRFVNENFFAVKIDAETREVLRFKGTDFGYMTNVHSNQLAWSLLNGVMEFPSTVFLDEGGNVLTVIPGFMDAGKMDVVLHYFNENAHLKPGLTFQQYEMGYARTKEE
jgi:thioredoxin-related protein